MRAPLLVMALAVGAAGDALFDIVNPSRGLCLGIHGLDPQLVWQRCHPMIKWRVHGLQLRPYAMMGEVQRYGRMDACVAREQTNGTVSSAVLTKGAACAADGAIAWRFYGARVGHGDEGRPPLIAPACLGGADTASLVPCAETNETLPLLAAVARELHIVSVSDTGPREGAARTIQVVVGETPGLHAGRRPEERPPVAPEGDPAALAIAGNVRAAPAASAPSDISLAAAGDGTPRSAVMTPYDLVAGGGESYILNTARALQGLGHEVYLLVRSSNPCASVDCVLSLARELNVDLAPRRLHVLARPSFAEFRNLTFEVFMLLGNEKAPDFPSLGRVGLYMCQFPFDMGIRVRRDALEHWKTYSAVLLNSHYTLGWYADFSAPMYRQAIRRRDWAPVARVLYPAVRVAGEEEVCGGSRGRRTRRIVMIGRFFPGRQNKAHLFAIRAFQQLREALGGRVTLHLVGTAMRTEEAANYLEGVYEAARAVPGVSLHVDAPAEDLRRLLCGASALWHLTGIDRDTSRDPASVEHFGIGVVEAMALGVVPIVHDAGGPAEIVAPARLPRVRSSRELVEATARVLSAGEAEERQMRRAAADRARSFSQERFDLEAGGILEGLLRGGEQRRRRLYAVAGARGPLLAAGRANATGALLFLVERPDPSLAVSLRNLLFAVNRRPAERGAERALCIAYAEGVRPFVDLLLQRIVHGAVHRRVRLLELPKGESAAGAVGSPGLWEWLAQHEVVLGNLGQAVLSEPIKAAYLLEKGRHVWAVARPVVTCEGSTAIFEARPAEVLRCVEGGAGPLERCFDGAVEVPLGTCL